MKDIKYVYVCGTSFTAGSGFEDTNPGRHIMQRLIDEPLPLTMEECSWPGQFNKHIDSKVYNYALPGAGVDYLIRTTLNWIEQNPTKIKDTLFLLEVSNYGRMEVWDSELQRYIICNWDYNVRKDGFCPTLHSGEHWKPNNDFESKIHAKHDVMEQWLNLFCDPIKETEVLGNRMFNFICRLKYLGIEFKLYGEPFIDESLKYDPLVAENTIPLFNKTGDHCCIYEFLVDNKLQIKDLTNGEVDDFHATFEGNKIISNTYLKYLSLKYNFVK
jgi:hypothetical protein